MEKGSLIGAPLAIGSICILMVAEGGSLLWIVGAPALLIVVGGCTGATFMHMPWHVCVSSLKAGKNCFLPPHFDYEALVGQITKLAGTARKDGLLALEKEAANIENPLLREAIKFAVDGLDPNIVSEIIDTRIDFKMHEKGLQSKFWTQMGAYAPTLAIVGAVLGLIIVMRNLDKPELIGPGIAVAFIATVYGVTLSNVFFLPMGGKLGVLNDEEAIYYEMIKVGVKDIQMGTSPGIIASRLMAMLDQEAKEEEA